MRISPDLLAACSALVLGVHFMCAVGLGLASACGRPGPGWRRARLAGIGTAVAGGGLTLTFALIFANRTPSRVDALESWFMLLGLLFAVAGQGMVLGSFAGGGAWAGPSSPSERRTRAYVSLAPMAVVSLLIYLWTSRGMI